MIASSESDRFHAPQAANIISEIQDGKKLFNQTLGGAQEMLCTTQGNFQLDRLVEFDPRACLRSP